jgi:hypothetical protein
VPGGTLPPGFAMSAPAEDGLMEATVLPRPDEVLSLYTVGMFARSHGECVRRFSVMQRTRVDALDPSALTPGLSDDEVVRIALSRTGDDDLGTLGIRCACTGLYSAALAIAEELAKRESTPGHAEFHPLTKANTGMIRVMVAALQGRLDEADA